MSEKKKKVTMTEDGRRKYDVKIGHGGNLTFGKDVVVLIDNENIDEGSKKTVELIKTRIRMGAKKSGHEFIVE